MRIIHVPYTTACMSCTCTCMSYTCIASTLETQTEGVGGVRTYQRFNVTTN